MIPVEEAQARVVAGVSVLPAETVALTDAAGRILAGPLAARRTQPPFAASAMDGYAVRAADIARVPVTLTQVGAVAAGGIYEPNLQAGQCVRIFTGAPLPAGADTVVIQEDTEANGDQILIREAEPKGRHVRAAGLDFGAGDLRLAAGTALSPRQLALAAAMDYPWLSVIRRPRVAILATGDEIVFPGEPIAPSQIVASTSTALAGFVRALGGEPVLLGVAHDTVASLREAAAAARDADVLVTIGGASVGEHDLVQTALKQDGLAVDFWKIAMRPGKPLMVGTMGKSQVLGLPGNPVSSLVCAVLFLRPLLFALQGRAGGIPQPAHCRTGADLEPNGSRQDYMRARLDADGRVVPFARQDSSMLTALAEADALIVRPPNAPAATTNDPVPALLLDGLL
ncbi:MAG: molybdopterin molybdotransferase MoeA [Alphaproteobacteria bacterium]|nr:molybdopterin molybdotransferase MoeA [Alphaproteobacteria bacterium]MCB9928160.1 molybdopterin molybdotransferase MoeA [Alphaproteobacteria bacterium]